MANTIPNNCFSKLILLSQTYEIMFSTKMTCHRRENLLTMKIVIR